MVTEQGVTVKMRKNVGGLVGQHTARCQQVSRCFAPPRADRLLTDLYEFEKVRPTLLSPSYPTHERTLSVKINANIYHALPGLVIIRYVLPARPADPHLLILDGENDQEVR